MKSYYMEVEKATEELEIEHSEKYNEIEVTICDDGKYEIWGNVRCTPGPGSSEFLEDGYNLCVSEEWLADAADEIDIDEE